MKRIAYTPTAAKQLGKLPAPVRDQLRAKLRRFAETGAGDVKPLVGRPGTRLRAGDYRIIFEETAEAIEVVAIGNRRDIYS